MADDLLAAYALRLLADRYAVAVDRRDGDALAALFTEGGVIDAPRGRFNGRAAIRKLTDMMTQLYDKTFHGVLTQVANISGERAKAETYCIARHFRQDNAGAYSCHEMTIRYQDECVSRNGVWLFAQRVLAIDATHSFAIDDPNSQAGERNG